MDCASTNMLMRTANKQTKWMDLTASPPKKVATVSRKGDLLDCNTGGNLVAERTNCTPAWLLPANG
jgi:hypothetical protein